MKNAVLFGVIQMLVGVMLSFSNAIFNRSMTDLVCMCVPQLIFMTLFFGYMDWMIVYKWTNVGLGNMPSIIGLLISMGLGQNLSNFDVCKPDVSLPLVEQHSCPTGPDLPVNGCPAGCMQAAVFDHRLFDGQYDFHVLNMKVMLLCVPWMLFPK